MEGASQRDGGRLIPLLLLPSIAIQVSGQFGLETTSIETQGWL